MPVTGPYIPLTLPGLPFKIYDGSLNPVVDVQPSGMLSVLGAGSGYRLGATDGSQGQHVISGGSTFLDYLGALTIRKLPGTASVIVADSNGVVGIGGSPGASLPAGSLEMITAGAIFRMKDTQNKYFRVQGGSWQIFDNGFAQQLLDFTDTGVMRFTHTGSGNVSIATTALPPAGNLLNLAGTQLGELNPRLIFYDDATNTSYISYGVDAQHRWKSTGNWLWQNVPTGGTRFGAGTTVASLGTLTGVFAATGGVGLDTVQHFHSPSSGVSVGHTHGNTSGTSADHTHSIDHQHGNVTAGPNTTSLISGSVTGPAVSAGQSVGHTHPTNAQSADHTHNSPNGNTLHTHKG